jgi:thymidine kinase
VVVRPTKSIRAHETRGLLVAKSGLRFPARECDRAAELLDIDGDVVWIDEPMLFDDEPDVFDVVQAIRTYAAVILSGLGATSELEPFGTSMPKLIAVADEVVQCVADCDDCHRLKTATRSVCLRPKVGAVLVGGVETYKAVCPTCWSTAARPVSRA